MCRAFSITKNFFSFFIDTILYFLHLYMRCSCFYGKIYSKLFKLHQLLPKLYTCKARFYFKWTFVVLIQIRGKRGIIFKTLLKIHELKCLSFFHFTVYFFYLSIYLFSFLFIIYQFTYFLFHFKIKDVLRYLTRHDFIFLRLWL